MPNEKIYLDLINFYKTKSNDLEYKLIIAQAEAQCYLEQVEKLQNEIAAKESQQNENKIMESQTVGRINRNNRSRKV